MVSNLSLDLLTILQIKRFTYILQNIIGYISCILQLDNSLNYWNFEHKRSWQKIWSWISGGMKKQVGMIWKELTSPLRKVLGFDAWVNNSCTTWNMRQAEDNQLSHMNRKTVKKVKNHNAFQLIGDIKITLEFHLMIFRQLTTW